MDMEQLTSFGRSNVAAAVPAYRELLTTSVCFAIVTFVPDDAVATLRDRYSVNCPICFGTRSADRSDFTDLAKVSATDGLLFARDAAAELIAVLVFTGPVGAS